MICDVLLNRTFRHPRPEQCLRKSAEAVRIRPPRGSLEHVEKLAKNVVVRAKCVQLAKWVQKDVDADRRGGVKWLVWRQHEPTCSTFVWRSRRARICQEVRRETQQSRWRDTQATRLNLSTGKNAEVAHESRWRAQLRFRKCQRVGLQCAERGSRSDASHSKERSTYNRSRHIKIRGCGLKSKEAQVLAWIVNENFWWYSS